MCTRQPTVLLLGDGFGRRKREKSHHHMYKIRAQTNTHTHGRVLYNTCWKKLVKKQANDGERIVKTERNRNIFVVRLKYYTNSLLQNPLFVRLHNREKHADGGTKNYYTLFLSLLSMKIYTLPSGKLGGIHTWPTTGPHTHTSTAQKNAAHTLRASCTRDENGGRRR